MRQIIYNQEDFLKIDYEIRKSLFDFIRWAELDLVEEEFDHFWFRIDIIKDDVILLYVLYRNAEDERILTWHIYLQECLEKFIKESGVDLGDLKILVIVESNDLWETED